MTEHSGATNNHIVHQHRPSYPDANSYPSPSLQNSYTYPPQGQQQGQPGDYRTPSTSSMAQHPVNLPPIRSFDGQTQPAAQQPSSAYPAPSTLPQPGPPMNSQYPPPHLPPPPAPQPYSLAAYAAQIGIGGMRYSMPQHLDQRNMSGGRHKKEIKRRTKTGCLTCRKRRIKVSEGTMMFFGGPGICETRFELGQDHAVRRLASERKRANRSTLSLRPGTTTTTPPPPLYTLTLPPIYSVTKPIPRVEIAKSQSASAWATTPFSSNSKARRPFSLRPALHHQRPQRQALQFLRLLNTPTFHQATCPQ